MKKQIAVLLGGILISASFGLAAGSSGYFKAVTGILVGTAGSPFTTAATAADVNTLYNAADFIAGQNINGCSLLNGVIKGCTATDQKVPLTVGNIRAGSGSQVHANFTNTVDADFQVRVSEVGAATRFSRIGPSVNVPLQFISRGVALEAARITSMKSDAAGTVSNSDGFNAGTYPAATGQYEPVLTFPYANNAVCLCNTGTGLCSANVVTSTIVHVNTYNFAGTLTNASFSLICAIR